MTKRRGYILMLVITAAILFPGSAAVLPASPAELIQAFSDAGLPILSRTVPIEDFSAELLDGNSVRLTDLTGKVVFLNFWATWCGPCRMEMPSMQALYQKLKGDGLEILAIDVQEDKRTAAAFIASNKLNFPTALDPSGRIAATYGIEAFPTTYIIDRKGNIISRVVGAVNWNTPALVNAFKTLLRE